MSELDKEAREILAVVGNLQPIIDAYKKGGLSEEEIIFLRAVMQDLWPTVQSVIASIWEQLEPIMIKLGMWPIEEEGFVEMKSSNGITIMRYPDETIGMEIRENLNKEE